MRCAASGGADRTGLRVHVTLPESVRRRVSKPRVVTVSLLAAAVGCAPRRVAAPAAGAGVTLRTDSARYTVRFAPPLYRVRIGFVYRNGTGTPVSTEYCREPGPPTLEKAVGGRWVPAYNPVTLLCQVVPPFRVAPGGTYRGTLDVAVAPRGTRVGPQLAVDSIAGTYRLRWALRAGPEPADPRAPSVEASSPPFQLVGP